MYIYVPSASWTHGMIAQSVRASTPFFYNQSIFDPHLEKFLSFSKKSPQKLLVFKY